MFDEGSKFFISQMQRNDSSPYLICDYILFLMNRINDLQNSTKINLKQLKKCFNFPKIVAIEKEEEEENDDEVLTSDNFQETLVEIQDVVQIFDSINYSWVVDFFDEVKIKDIQDYFTTVPCLPELPIVLLEFFQQRISLFGQFPNTTEIIELYKKTDRWEDFEVLASVISSQSDQSPILMEMLLYKFVVITPEFYLEDKKNKHYETIILRLGVLAKYVNLNKFMKPFFGIIFGAGVNILGWLSVLSFYLKNDGLDSEKIVYHPLFQGDNLIASEYFYENIVKDSFSAELVKSFIDLNAKQLDEARERLQELLLISSKTQMS
jgi:hypothetical protein